jgi:tetratricopeptide (TPR) repeat protein
MSVIRQWFAALHDTLDQLILRYPEAGADERARLQEQWDLLKSFSDDIVENWLLLEEKMSLFREVKQEEAIIEEPEMLQGPFQKGQGYFKLQMFPQAAEQLEETLRVDPDLLPARLYLAMCRMHLKQWADAQRHFRLIAATAEDGKLQAIAYNALGCIQAVFSHLEHARQLFRKAMEADPTLKEPRHNLERCRQGGAELELQFGSAELQAMV